MLKIDKSRRLIVQTISKNRRVSDIEKIGKDYFFIHFGYKNRTEYTFPTMLEAMVRQEEILYVKGDLKKRVIIKAPIWRELLKTNMFKRI